MKILAIDPGTEKSAWVIWDGKEVRKLGIEANHMVLESIKAFASLNNNASVVIEEIQGYGMPVGKTVFQTVFWCGRFAQTCINSNVVWDQVPRREVKLHLCGSVRAKDSNVRQALIDRFGKPGRKKDPGVTYGLKKDLWQAFALAVYYHDTQPKKSPSH